MDIKKSNYKLLMENDDETESLSLSDSRNGITIIAAAAANDALGKDNKLIWHISDDLKKI